MPALILGAVGIGFAPIFVRLAGATGVEPVASAFWRLTLAVPLMLPWVLWRGRAARRRTTVERSETASPAARWALGAAGLFFAADLALWHWSITLTSVANATLLANLNTVFVALISYFFFKEWLNLRFWAGLAAALAGAALLLRASLVVGGPRPLGDLLGVLTATMYAGYFLSVRAARRGLGTTAVLFGSSIVTAAALLPVALLLGEGIWPSDGAAWLPLFGLAAVSQLIGQGLIIFALKHLPAAFSAVSLLMQPVVAAIAAWGLFGEALGPVELAGGVAVLVGINLARLGSARR
ncbi:MAG: DMT family transporter [Rhodothalassiaceae bacterium]